MLKRNKALEIKEKKPSVGGDRRQIVFKNGKYHFVVISISPLNAFVLKLFLAKT
jgi:uncharacterized protein with GYD domain